MKNQTPKPRKTPRATECNGCVGVSYPRLCLEIRLRCYFQFLVETRYMIVCGFEPCWNLVKPGISYIAEARLGRKLCDPIFRVVQKTHQVLAVDGRMRGHFHQVLTVVSFVSSMGSVTMHCALCTAIQCVVLLHRRSQSARGTQPQLGARKRSPLPRENSRCAAPTCVRRYSRQFIWWC